jgi:hypothetical protein
MAGGWWSAFCRIVSSFTMCKPAIGRRCRLLARLALLLFGGFCCGYFRLCLAVGYAMAWSFLGGFVVAAPFALIAVRAQRRWVRWGANAIGFTIYFWVSGLMPGWKQAGRG